MPNKLLGESDLAVFCVGAQVHDRAQGLQPAGRRTHAHHEAQETHRRGITLFFAAVMWIHKIWSMRIRIQNNSITKLILNHLFKVKKYFQICTYP